MCWKATAQSIQCFFDRCRMVAKMGDHFDTIDLTANLLSSSNTLKRPERFLNRRKVDTVRKSYDCGHSSVTNIKFSVQRGLKKVLPDPQTGPVLMVVDRFHT